MPPPLDQVARETLLGIADAAITRGLRGLPPRPADPKSLPEPLRTPRAAFVSLFVGDRLNGCIGSVQADAPLADQVARHAWAAAFADPRLPLLTPADYPMLAIEISVLSALVPVAATSRDELLARLRPGRDGLLICTASARAVFLPQVWEQLPEPATFLDRLLAKAGLPTGTWPPDLAGYRFVAQTFSGSPAPPQADRPGRGTGWAILGSNQ